MCLASEAGKMDAVVSQPEDSCSTAFSLQTTVKNENEKEKADADDNSPSSHAAPLLPSVTSATSTSTVAIPPHLSGQNACVKNKSKKRELAKPNDTENPCPAKKIIKKSDHAESNIDSVFSTIEAVAKGAWKDTDESIKSIKRIQTSLSVENLGVPKKKSKPKVKPAVKGKEEVEDDSGQCGVLSFPEVALKQEMQDISPKSETEEASIESTELQSNIAELHQFPCSPSSTKLKEEDKGKERPSDWICDSNIESRGSRKSERSCKGALYKTLVSEGMLTSLRANIDRGTHFNSTVW